jgi:predicted transcriptional regulator
MYSKFGFVDRPLNPSGVPPIERRYSPVGFEGELSRVKAAIDSFLRGNDNIAVVVVGQYGWGKSELLDAVEVEAIRRGLKVLRLPLTFGLDVNTVINTLLKFRGDSSEPVLVLIDEADEVSRVFELGNALDPNDAGRVRDLVVRLGSLIRALIEPRNYRDVLGVDPRRLGRVMLILAFTPQLYYNILRNMVPDVFDITRGRVYAEIALDERMPLWLYEAMLIQRFNAYSTEDRLGLVRRGLVNPLYPLRREYLVTLYELVSNTEGGKPSPRALVKFTSKLLDMVVERGELNYGVFEEFLKSEASTGELRVFLDAINEGPTDEAGSRVFKALLLSGVPRTVGDLSSELGFDVSPVISALVRAGFVEEVQVVRVGLNGDGLARVNNELVRLGLAPIEGDLRDISVNYGTYYTVYEDGPMLYVVLPSDAKINLVGAFRAFQVSPRLHRLLVFGREVEELVRAREEVGKAIAIVNQFRDELASEVVRAALASPVTLYPVVSNVWVGVFEGPLDVRLGVIVGLDVDVEGFVRFLSKVVSEGVISINGQERVLDSLLVIVASRSQLTNDLVKSVVNAVVSLPWKVVLGPLNDFAYFSVFGSDAIDSLRSIVIGSRLERLDRVPREYSIFIERLSNYRNEVSAFRDRVRQRVLQYTMAIRRGAKESREAVIRRIVKAWVENGELNDQPEIFRDENGKARISIVEESFINYLRSLGKRSFTTKELEYLIRRLYPTHLWREFRESDLIRLLSLRGLLLPINEDFTEYAPYSLDTAPKTLEILSNYLKNLREGLTKPLIIKVEPLDMKIEVEPGIEVQGNDCERQLSLLRAVPETSSEFLRRLSSFMICLDGMRDFIEGWLEGLNTDVSTVESQLNNVIKDVITKLNDARVGLGSELSKLNGEVEARVNALLDRIRSYLGRLGGLRFDDVKESLPSILEVIDSETRRTLDLINILRSISDSVREYMDLTSVLGNAYIILNRKYVSMSIDDFINDITLLLKLNSADTLNNYLTTLNRALEAKRKEVSEALSAANALVNNYIKAAAWLRKRSDGKILKGLMSDVVLDVPTPSPNYENARKIIDAIRSIDRVISGVAKELGIPSDVVMAIASLGPNVGIDESDLAGRLGLDADTINKYLEALWRHGLIERRYVT